MVYAHRLIKEAFEEFWGGLVLLSFNGVYAEDYFVIGIFDKKHLALAHALKELKKMKEVERENPNSIVKLINREGREIKFSHDYYQKFVFKKVKLNEEIKD